MGMDPISSLNLDDLSLSKERVGSAKSLAEDPDSEMDPSAHVMTYADAVKASPRQDANG